MALDTETQAQRSTQPAWFRDLWSDYLSGMSNVIILHGHVHDYVEHPSVNLTVRQYLENMLGTLYAVATYAPDEGILFSGPPLIAKENRAWFDLALGRQAAASPSTGGGFDAAALLRQETGGGFGGNADEAPLPADAPTALALLVDFLKKADQKAEGAPSTFNSAGRLIGKRAAVIVERLDLIAPPSEKDRLGGGDRALLSLLHRSGTSETLNNRRNLMILLAPSLEEVHPDLRQASSGIRTIAVPPPTFDQRLTFITRALGEVTNDEGMVTREAITLTDITEVELANATAGLNRRHIEDLVLRAAHRDGQITREMVRIRKSEQIGAEYAGALTILEPDVSFGMVGGHDALKAYLQEEVIDLMRDPEKSDDCPMGILFSGPSGTGKTYLFRALARETGFNAVSLDPDNLRDMYVGGSERKTKKAIEGVLAMAPCLVLIDEIDTKLRRPSGGQDGSGVEGNIFGMMLEFLGDQSHRGQVVLVAATNRPDRIDAALKRPGRIDLKVPLLPPDGPMERAKVLASLLARHGMDDLADESLLALGEETDNTWTQAELEGLVLTARRGVRLRGRTTWDAMNAALDEMVPSTEDIALHTELAVRTSSNRTLVPARWRPLVGKARQSASPAAAPPTGRVGATDSDFDLTDIG